MLPVSYALTRVPWATVSCIVCLALQVKDATWDGAYVDVIDQEIEHRCQIRVMVQAPPPLLPMLPPCVTQPPAAEA